MKVRSMVMVMLLVLVAGCLAIGLAVKPVGADIAAYEWTNTTYQGLDGFYGANIVAYKTGAGAELIARVVNNQGSDISIDYGRLELGWDATPLEAVERPTTIASGDYALFRWTFEVPSNTAATNLLMHTYEITVQYDEPGNPDRQWSESGANLVVYSEEQAASRDSIDKWDANMSSYVIWGYEGRRAMTEAWYLYNKAEAEYDSGNFVGAAADYAAAVTTQEKAINADASAALTNQSAQTLEGTGGMKGIGYLIAGIGIAILGLSVGIGVIAWGLRRQ
jgi:hypothetical protein